VEAEQAATVLEEVAAAEAEAESAPAEAEAAPAEEAPGKHSHWDPDAASGVLAGGTDHLGGFVKAKPKDRSSMGAVGLPTAKKVSDGKA
jgi:hypothetical protein